MALWPDFHLFPTLANVAGEDRLFCPPSHVGEGIPLPNTSTKQVGVVI